MRTVPSRRCAARTTAGRPSTCMKRVTTPRRTRMTASPPPPAGSRYGHGGRISTSRQPAAGLGRRTPIRPLPAVAEDVDVDQKGTARDDARRLPAPAENAAPTLALGLATANGAYGRDGGGPRDQSTCCCDRCGPHLA